MRSKHESMTGRERILAAIEGRQTDRFPVWLKMANDTWLTSQDEPYRSMESAELLRGAGCDLLLDNEVRVVAERPRVTVRVEDVGRVRRRITETPDGTLVGEETIDPHTNSSHPTKYMAESAAELRALRWLFVDATCRVEDAEAEEGRRRQERLIALNAVSVSYVGPSPLMKLVEELCGPLATFYLAADEPELFRETLRLMHEANLRRLRARFAVESADTVWMVENTSTTLISPSMFREFCAPCLTDYCLLARANGIIPILHMCGTLNAILEDIDAIPADANEAYTTRPLGDVSLAEGRRRMPSKTLIGGTNATLWLKDVDTIVETVASDLAECPDRRRIFLTSAGVLPPLVSFEKAAEVVERLKRL